MNKERIKPGGNPEEPKHHIRLDENRFVKTTDKKKGRGRTNYVKTPIKVHRRFLTEKFFKTESISKERRRLFLGNAIYLKLSLTKDVSSSNQLLNKFGFTILRVIKDKKAIVSISDEDSDKLKKNLASKEAESYFKQMEDIEPLKTEEKISKPITDAIAKAGREELIDIEIEFFRNLDLEKYQRVIGVIQKFLSEKNGRMLSKVIEKDYCRLDAKVSISSINELAQGIEPIESIDELKKYRVGISKIQKQKEEIPQGEKEKKPPPDATTVCIIDTGVQKNHFFLGNVIKKSIDYTRTNDSDNVGHGTFIAGLIAYDDLSHIPISSPDIKIISAKILNSAEECIPDIERKVSDIVHQFHSETRIFNFSLSYGLCHRVSHLAEVIDRLERTYDVLFVIPTGNIGIRELQNFIMNGRYFPNYFSDDSTKICSPAEACNAITVGSFSEKESNNSIAKRFCPSPFTRHGLTPDMRQKPDLIESGGNIEYGSSSFSTPQINNMIAIKSLDNNGGFRYDLGTSFATALVSRTAAQLLKIYPSASINLIKALMINAALPPKCNDRNLINNRKIVGWGRPGAENAFYSNPNRVTYFLESQINTSKEKIVKIRVPEEMRKIRGLKRMIFTLVFDPPVDSSKHPYSKVDLKLRLWKAGTPRKILQKRTENDGAVKTSESSNFQRHGWRNDNLKREDWDNVKYGIFEWQRGKKQWWKEDWEVHIIPRVKFLDNDIDQKFALVITLEDPNHFLFIDLYSSICNELDIEIEEKVRVRV